jgi:putative nucleotidyltransferase with HDIG domain
MNQKRGNPMLTERARTTLHEWVQADSLRKHCEAVAACMRHFAKQQGADEDLWCAVGLLHDMDYEKHPDLEVSDTAHPFVAVNHLRKNGWGEDVCRAILSHADHTGIERITPMEKTLYAVDELSGFVTAVALVRPDKNIASVKVSSVKKKMKDKAFAAKVNREDIKRGAEELGVPLDDVIQEVILGLQAEAERLGIDGQTG